MRYNLCFFRYQGTKYIYIYLPVHHYPHCIRYEYGLPAFYLYNFFQNKKTACFVSKVLSNKCAINTKLDTYTVYALILFSSIRILTRSSSFGHSVFIYLLIYLLTAERRSETGVNIIYFYLLTPKACRCSQMERLFSRVFGYFECSLNF